MSNIVAIGIQWGDEGKGKVVDLLAPEMDIVARFQGGPNAGHTLIIDGNTTILHHIPSGILHSDTLSLIGNGAVVDCEKLLDEMDMLEQAGIPVLERLRISDRCHLILPWHRKLDGVREAGNQGTYIGTTGCGIGPAYEDKVARRGIRLADLACKNLDARIQSNLDYYNHQLVAFHHADPVSLSDVEQVLALAKARLLPLSTDISTLIDQKQRDGASVLFEGAQGSMLDVDHGTYPFVTSSNTTVGAALAGLGVGPQQVDQVLGIAKAYATRVGEGPFPTELYDGVRNLDPIGKQMADVGKEFGATTGRSRRTGWFDAAVIRHAVRINGITGLAITKLDILDGFQEVKVGIGYRHPAHDGVIDTLPSTADDYAQCDPVYEKLPGWEESTFGSTDAAQLPVAVHRFIQFIEQQCGVPVVLISTGPDRSHVIRLKPEFFGNCSAHP